MFERKVLGFTVTMLVVWTGAVTASADLASNWNDFVHFTQIGKLDLAKGYGQAIVDSNADPLELLQITEENPTSYELLVKLNASNSPLTDVSGKLLGIIEQGRFIRRSDPKIINEEIARLSGTPRGRIAAVERLKNAGEYAIPYLVAAMQDPSRKEEFPNIVGALPQLGKGAVRPLIAALQMRDVGIKAEIINALGQMRYTESLGYIKYISETTDSNEVRTAGARAVARINASGAQSKASELFFQLGEQYYNHADSLAPGTDSNTANIWFWDHEGQSLTRQKISTAYFNELMAMRACEWSLKADPNMGKSIGLWLGAFFKAQSHGIPMPAYFGTAHADAMTYARTAGPEYLHQALSRALKNKETFVVLNVVEALGASAGEKSLFYRIGVEQPLMQALSYPDKSVQYSAALAIAAARPIETFNEHEMVTQLLASALAAESNDLADETKAAYAQRSLAAIRKLAQSRNKIIDLTKVEPAIIKVADNGGNTEMQTEAIETLAWLDSADAQRALAALGLAETTAMPARLAAFAALAWSAKINANLLTDQQVSGLYAIISSEQAPAELRSAAAGAYGALNLPSRKVKTLIVDQAKS